MAKSIKPVKENLAKDALAKEKSAKKTPIKQPVKDMPELSKTANPKTPDPKKAGGRAKDVAIELPDLAKPSVEVKDDVKENDTSPAATNPDHTQEIETANTDTTTLSKPVPFKSKPSDPRVASKTSLSGSAFFALLLGGILAGAIGFGAARYPDQWPFSSAAQTDPLQEKIAALQTRIDAVEAAVQNQQGTLGRLQNDTDLTQLRADLKAQRETLSALTTTQITPLEARLKTLERAAQGTQNSEAAAAATAAYERDLQQMREMLEVELARIGAAQEDAKTLKVDAVQTASAALSQAAMARILTAIEAGLPFQNALSELDGNTELPIPDVLLQHAASGVESLVLLQERFPQLAREALDVSVRAAVETGEMTRMTAFLRTQLGLRSLEPKMGDDPDAILSRAEAALKNDELSTVLDELERLPDAAKSILSDWIAQAKTRNDVVNAGQNLAVQLKNR